MEMSVVLTSSVIAALIAGIFAYRLGERQIQVENITQERAKWRANVKELVDGLITAARNHEAEKFEKLVAQIQLNLNPFDSDDKALLKAGRNIYESDDQEIAIKTFVEHVTLLLKHDWERAKGEASLASVFSSPPRRLSYQEYVQQSEPHDPAAKVAKDNRGLWAPFLGLMFASGILFFLAVGLKEPFSQLLRHFNDPDETKAFVEWLIFTLVSALFGLIWSCLYLWFKNSEKRFLDRWQKRKS